jgi:hypothetical protein
MNDCVVSVEISRGLKVARISMVIGLLEWARKRNSVSFMIVMVLFYFVLELITHPSDFLPHTRRCHSGVDLMSDRIPIVHVGSSGTHKDFFFFFVNGFFALF